MNALATAWFDGLAWLCPVCLVESDDTACNGCGRPLTSNDLTSTTADRPEPVHGVGTGGRQEKPNGTSLE